MPKNDIKDFDATASNNTDINSVNIAEGCAPSGINNAIRELMADLKNALFAKINVTADTSAGDDAAMGYTAAEGLILTGQGSTNDVTIKNDADADVITIATGTTNVNIVGGLTATSFGGIASANLLDKTATEAVTGQYTFTAPILGTPASGVATNLTGTAAGLTAGNVTTNANLTGHITSVGNAAVLGSFTSAQLATALSNETGSGSAVFATSPTLVTPALGTPASGVATNITGLPAASVLAGSFGTGDYAITGDLSLSTAGSQINVGAAALNYAQVSVGGSFTSGGNNTITAGFRGGSTIIGANGDTTYQTGMTLTNNITTQNNSETIADVAQLRLDEPAITKGNDTITNASTLHISGAPSEGASNYALLIDSGAVNLGSGAVTTTGTLASGSATITNTSSGALTTGLLLTNATATSANTAVAFYLSPNAAGTARAASIVSEQTTSGNYADLTFNVANGDTPFEAMSIATTGNITIPAGDLHFASGKDIIFDADGTTDVGKTGARAANVWSDLVNGADYGFENGWRALESDTYAGYSTGIAFDFGEHFEDGKALAVNKVLTGQKIKSGRQIPTGTKIATGFQEEVDGKLVDIFDDEMVDEMIEETVRERVTNISKIPTFVVTNDFIEFKGRRITASDLDKLLALI